MATSLYRMYDGFGDLLYVGITDAGLGRFKQHSGDKAWWTFVEHIRVEHYGSRAEARSREKRVIAAEHPVFNSAHNTFRDSKILEYLERHHTRDTDPAPLPTAARTPDHLSRFVAECLVVGLPESAKVTSRTLIATYIQWCHAAGETPLTENKFGRELTARFGIGSARTGQGRLRTGVSLSPTAPAVRPVAAGA